MEEKNYYVWSNEHNAWWAPSHCGYVSLLRFAGLYTLKEATEICNGANYGWDVDRSRCIPNELPINREAAELLQYKKFEKRAVNTCI